VNRADRRKLIAKGVAMAPHIELTPIIGFGAVGQPSRRCPTSSPRSNDSRASALTQDGRHHGHIPDSMSDLCSLNWLGKPRHLERNCGLHECSYVRGVCARSSPRRAIVIATAGGMATRAAKEFGEPLHEFLVPLRRDVSTQWR
jgi:hypothetical protein